VTPCAASGLPPSLTPLAGRTAEVQCGTGGSSAARFRGSAVGGTRGCICPTNGFAAGEQAALCFSIDNVHSGRLSDFYEAGGDLDKGALGHVQWHPQLRATLFASADR
jgi:hypothetical protein